MQTFLWHPLTPKCTWPSQNKSKKTLRKYWENFFRKYAPFYIQGVGIFTEITVVKKVFINTVGDGKERVECPVVTRRGQCDVSHPPLLHQLAMLCNLMIHLNITFFYIIVQCKMHCNVKKLKKKTMWCNTEICIPPTCGPEGLAVLQSISIHRPPVRPTCRGHDSSSPFLLHSSPMHFSSTFSSTDKTSKVQKNTITLQKVADQRNVMSNDMVWDCRVGPKYCDNHLVSLICKI